MISYQFFRLYAFTWLHGEIADKRINAATFGKVNSVKVNDW